MENGNLVGAWWNELRVQGSLSGSTEYVFRRKAYCDFTSKIADTGVNIPTQSNSFLYTGVNKEVEIVNPFESWSPLSRFPASFALKEIWDVSAMSSIGHQMAQLAISENAEPEKFDARMRISTGSGLRRKVSISLLNNCSKSYLTELKNSISGFASSGVMAKIFLKGAAYLYRGEFLKNHLQSFTNVTNQIVCRIRHFVDLEGYSLACHNDSDDTLMALIAPLIPWSTTTSLVTSGPYDRSYEKFQSADLINDNSFINDARFATFGDRTYCDYIARNGGNQLVLCEIPYSISQLNISAGEALLLPNILSSALLPRRAIDKEMRLKELFGHSVCPPVKEIYRPILIADFLIIPGGKETTSEEPNEFIIPLTTVSKFISQIVSLF